MNPARKLLFAAALLFAGLGVACIGPSVRGTFDRTLTVTAPARLYLSNGSGSTRIQAGPPGQIHIHGEFRVQSWVFGNPHRTAAQLAANPPIRQEGSLVRVGSAGLHAGHVSVDYTISVPPGAEVHVTTGSGDLAVAGVTGPVTVTLGSGDLDLREIQGNVRATSGSGDVHMENVSGSVEITVGSGDISLGSVSGRVRVATGSGDVTVSAPGSDVTLRSGSGDVSVTGASRDLRIRSGFGSISVAGAPSSGAYWELHAGTGDVTLRVPTGAAFDFHARSRMGDIETHVPVTVLERRRHELRAVVGHGGARLEVETGTGDVVLEATGP